MKIFKLFAATLLLFAFTANLNAQCQLDKAQLKTAKKTAKKNEKEGWKVKPGGLPLIEQEKRAMSYQLDYANWQLGSASSIGTVYDTALISAMAIAKANLASNIQTQLSTKFGVDVGNSQIGIDEANSKAEAAMKSQAITVNQTLSNPIVLYEAYQTRPNGNIEVIVRIAVPKQNVDKLVDNIFENAK